MPFCTTKLMHYSQLNVICWQVTYTTYSRVYIYMWNFPLPTHVCRYFTRFLLLLLVLLLLLFNFFAFIAYLRCRYEAGSLRRLPSFLLTAEPTAGNKLQQSRDCVRVCEHSYIMQFRILRTCITFQGCRVKYTLTYEYSTWASLAAATLHYARRNVLPAATLSCQAYLEVANINLISPDQKWLMPRILGSEGGCSSAGALLSPAGAISFQQCAWKWVPWRSFMVLDFECMHERESLH